MNKKMWLSGFLILSTTGCSAMNNTEKGMLGGAAVGTGAGAILGRGNPGAMLVGGAVGTMVGGVSGSNQDRREDRRAVATLAANEHARIQLRLTDIVNMSQSRVPDHMIIREIDTTGSMFALSPDDLIYLRQQGVSDSVISVMQVRRARSVVVHPRPDVIYVAPPPPPVYVEPGFSVGVRGRF